MLTAQFLISRHWQWSDGANIRRVCNCTCLGMEQWIAVGSQEGSERIFQAKRARASAQGGAWYKRVQGEETNVAGMEISFWKVEGDCKAWRVLAHLQMPWCDAHWKAIVGSGPVAWNNGGSVSGRWIRHWHPRLAEGDPEGHCCVSQGSKGNICSCSPLLTSSYTSDKSPVGCIFFLNISLFELGFYSLRIRILTFKYFWRLRCLRLWKKSNGLGKQNWE